VLDDGRGAGLGGGVELPSKATFNRPTAIWSGAGAAGVLVPPEWQATAAARRDAAFAEIASRVALDGYSWQPQTRHPLSYWANHQGVLSPVSRHSFAT